MDNSHSSNKGYSIEQLYEIWKDYFISLTDKTTVKGYVDKVKRPISTSIDNIFQPEFQENMTETQRKNWLTDSEIAIASKAFTHAKYCKHSGKSEVIYVVNGLPMNGIGVGQLIQEYSSCPYFNQNDHKFFASLENSLAGTTNLTARQIILLEKKINRMNEIVEDQRKGVVYLDQTYGDTIDFAKRLVNYALKGKRVQNNPTDEETLRFVQSYSTPDKIDGLMESLTMEKVRSDMFANYKRAANLLKAYVSSIDPETHDIAFLRAVPKYHSDKL